ncbi:hypothetical protein EAS64_30025 [Trebonia kvetii]|uniref:Uncharacterized protein n=1 Tax=Trebonia kvetii TaxID=2480626 RepID=A0A6P2BST0_9ACTN|nr:hypothetical protein [Trebonia kvetii]TVZ01707.1 hypothetical protein EAS64_30025 [Trebonia kvetii]
MGDDYPRLLVDRDVSPDTYPSGMARDMGGGMQLYILRPGVPGRPDLVRIFDEAPPDQLATVDEQRAFHQAWLAERRTQ